MDHYSPLLEDVARLRPRRILEVGVWDGGHAEQMIRASGCAEYYGFDLFGPCPDYEMPKQPPAMATVWARLRGLGASVTLIQGNTRETLPAVQLPPMDLIFLDGGHSLEAIASDWREIQRFTRPGTVIWIDDYYPDRTDAGAKPLVDSLAGAVLTGITEYPGLRVQMARVVC